MGLSLIGFGFNCAIVTFKCKGFGSWVHSLSKLQVTDPSDYLKVKTIGNLLKLKPIYWF